MNYEVLENQVYTKILPMDSVEGITVRRMPENEADRKKAFPGNAQLTVIYAGSEYPETISTSQVSQDEKVFIQILIESSFLRGPQGIYNLLAVLKTLLIGFRPSFCTGMQVVKHHTIGGDEAEKVNNMWNYNVIFQARAVAVEDFTEDLSILLKKITLIDQPDEETNVIPNTN